MKNLGKIVLAYSGGLDTTVILHWLVQKRYEVVCFVADVGQNEDFDQVKERALKIGASKVYVKNLQKEFVQDYVLAALKANAVYEGSYLLGTALARPLIAKHQIEIAKTEETNLLAHGATGKGNDQVRFEFTYAALMPNAQIISPWKDEAFLKEFKGRFDLINYVKKHNLGGDFSLNKIYSIDENLMHTSFESGYLENLECSLPEEIYRRTSSISKAFDVSTSLSIMFEQGIPLSVNNQFSGEKIVGAVELFKYLNDIGGKNGIGRVDMVENRIVGIKSRGVYESPAGSILIKAHKELESITLDKEVLRLKEFFAIKIAELIYNGLWASPEMCFLMQAINHSQKNVTGCIDLELYKGNIIVKKRKSSFSLYDSSLSSMNEFGGYDQRDAKGFIKIQSLRLKNGVLL